MVQIKRALISVWDKTGLEELVSHLAKHNVEIISTGGTLQKIREMGLEAKSIGRFTQFPEMLDGRVKTLHPKVHGGLLYLRDNEEHQKQTQEHNIENIDLVVVNLYPFIETISQPGFTHEEAIENIDIGGPTMLRAAAKNHKHVAAVINPRDYEKIILEMNENNGALSTETRFELARKVFNYTASYDAAISAYLNDLQGITYPKNLTLAYTKVQDLRYGENPHQKAALYKDQIHSDATLVNAKQIQGKELSFNNLLDFDAAVSFVQEFKEPCVCIIKHNNPAGIAIGSQDQSLDQVYQKAWQCDPVSAFGSIIAINRPIDTKTAEQIAKNFVEGIVAPGFSEEALAILSKKKNIRLMQAHEKTATNKRYDLKRISGGILVQEEDESLYGDIDLKIVTQHEPNEQEMRSLLFHWRIAKYTKSNAIVIGGPHSIYGVGAGQMSRVDAVKIAVSKAEQFHHQLKGAVLASDAFFPFRDGLDEAARHGISAIIQPGGSVKDAEVIAAADDHGIAMVFTSMRHFRH